MFTIHLFIIQWQQKPEANSAGSSLIAIQRISERPVNMIISPGGEQVLHVDGKTPNTESAGDSLKQKAQEREKKQLKVASQSVPLIISSGSVLSLVEDRTLRGVQQQFNCRYVMQNYSNCLRVRLDIRKLCNFTSILCEYSLNVLSGSLCSLVNKLLNVFTRSCSLPNRM